MNAPCPPTGVPQLTLPSSEIAPTAFAVDALKAMRGTKVYALPLPARRGTLIRARKQRRARRPGLGYRAGSRPVMLANQSATAASEPTVTV